MGSQWQNSHQLQQGSIRPFASSAALVFTQHHQAVSISPFPKMDEEKLCVAADDAADSSSHLAGQGENKERKTASLNLAISLLRHICFHASKKKMGD